LNYTSKKDDKVALVTGSARRIGADIAKALHNAGFRVAIHCHQSLAEARALAQMLNNLRRDSACVFQEDLGRPAVGQKLISSVEAWSQRLDVLVNNASLFLQSNCLVFDSKAWQDLFTINVQKPFELSTAAYPLLAKTNGSIINITDIHAEKPLKGYAVYCQTKAALLMQTKALAREFAPRVRVNAVAPGAIAWPEKDNALTEEIQQKIIDNTPLGCHGKPAYIASAVLAFVENPFITGQFLNVDGGRSIV
jgi:pteridine reductase